jgi:hypothetical protein
VAGRSHRFDGSALSAGPPGRQPAIRCRRRYQAAQHGDGLGRCAAARRADGRRLCGAIEGQMPHRGSRWLDRGQYQMDAEAVRVEPDICRPGMGSMTSASASAPLRRARLQLCGPDAAGPNGRSPRLGRTLDPAPHCGTDVEPLIEVVERDAAVQEHAGHKRSARSSSSSGKVGTRARPPSRIGFQAVRPSNRRLVVPATATANVAGWDGGHAPFRPTGAPDTPALAGTEQGGVQLLFYEVELSCQRDASQPRAPQHLELPEHLSGVREESTST